MDYDVLETIETCKEVLSNFIVETKFEKLLGPLPNSFLGEEPDPRGIAMLYLSWLLTDWGDYKYLCTLAEVGELLKNIGEAILSRTEPI